MEHLAFDALTPVHTQFALLSQHWFLPLWTAANWVFNAIVIADIVVFVIARSTVPELFFYIFVERIFYILIFKFILLNAGWLIPSVINGFIEVATTAGDIQALSPQKVAAQGLWLMARLIAQLFGWNMLWYPFNAIMTAFCAIGIALAYFFIAFSLSLTMIEMYIVTGAGVFLLGFGGWSATAGITHRYLSYVVGVGVKLFMTYLLISGGDVLIRLWGEMVNSATTDNFSTPMALLFGVMAYGLSVWMIPSLTSSLLTGSVGMGLMESVQTTAAVTRMMISSVATGGAAVAGYGALNQLRGIAKESNRIHGGGLRGALAGMRDAANAGGEQLFRGMAPRLSHGMDNLREQREKMQAQPARP